MRKTLKDIRMLASLLLAGAALLSCSSDDETPASTPETPETPKTCTMTVQATKGADTRALAVDGTELASTWTAGDVVTVLSEDGSTTYGTLTAQSSGASTTLTGTLETAPANGASLLLKYLSDSYGVQDGTLTGTDNSIDKVCDYSTATVTATVSGDHVTTTDANFANQQAIVKFTLTDGTNAINATALTVSDGTNNITLSNIPSATYTANGDGVLYVALPGFSSQTVSLTATTADKTYVYSKTGVTFTNSSFYRIQVTMNELVGLLSGKFTINSSGTKVGFSQGNLQATYNGTNWTWSFATTQWGYIGNAAGNTSVTSSSPFISGNGTVDLFGWVGASSTWTDVNKYGITSSDAINAIDGYGNVATESLKSDWGTLAITNGGNTANSGWRTLTSAEWKYLLDTRTTGGTVFGTATARYAHATINTDGTSVNGLILFPDGVDIASSEVATAGSVNAASAYATKCTTAQWAALAAKGCVFLPAAGNRDGATVSNAGSRGRYWSSTPNASNANHAYSVYFISGNLYPQNGYNRRNGFSVRLVR